MYVMLRCLFLRHDLAWYLEAMYAYGIFQWYYSGRRKLLWVYALPVTGILFDLFMEKQLALSSTFTQNGISFHTSWVTLGRRSFDSERWFSATFGSHWSPMLLKWQWTLRIYANNTTAKYRSTCLGFYMRIGCRRYIIMLIHIAFDYLLSVNLLPLGSDRHQYHWCSLTGNQWSTTLWKYSSTSVWYLLIHLLLRDQGCICNRVIWWVHEAHLRDHVNTHIMRRVLIIVQSPWGMTNDVIDQAPYHLD